MPQYLQVWHFSPALNPLFSAALSSKVLPRCHSTHHSPTPTGSTAAWVAQAVQTTAIVPPQLLILMNDECQPPCLQPSLPPAVSLGGPTSILPLTNPSFSLHTAFCSTEHLTYLLEGRQMGDHHLDLQACTFVYQTPMHSLTKVCPGVRPTATHLSVTDALT